MPDDLAKNCLCPAPPCSEQERQRAGNTKQSKQPTCHLDPGRAPQLRVRVGMELHCDHRLQVVATLTMTQAAVAVNFSVQDNAVPGYGREGGIESRCGHLEAEETLPGCPVES